ncbi:glycosyltransferase family 8 protein [Salegentibacter mishustinae]|uniref:Glycosyl transferase n=1 Tax=Salegentibacter mishustinae TaxID=270918 RepID=A0A0Q9Z869_9FLAO|nr:glycosyltransferase [Salegentibacter mishustinae]KRG29164.1 hypothetical protein APR42_04330 [Salegentibacter mishustinae]PNW21784.1 hypothetical protein APB85_11155 [Salegentibacter mishustinae]PZX65127.1 lipopolysaccharide biosynthesis glycosyltransferase [Salegentibacter mishustinae]GGW87158.1 general stress protein A [Salegentibacter mishustinae]
MESDVHSGDRVNIVTYADGFYIQHACLMLMSLKDVISRDREYDVFVYYSNCDEKLLSKFKNSLGNYLPQNVSYQLIECDFGISDKLKAKSAHLSASIYDKVLIYDRIPSHINKVVFFDADIILEKDPAIIFDIDLGDDYVGAVKDQVFENFTKEAKLTLEISANQYFNTGVMLVNLIKWRHDKISKRSLEFALEKWDLTPYHDQDAFNYVIKGNWKEISPLWNPRILNKIIIKGEEKIYNKMQVYRMNLSYLVHYSGPEKPWLYMSFHPKKNVYLNYLKISEFKDYKFPDYNFKNLIKKQIIGLRRRFYFFRKRLRLT